MSIYPANPHTYVMSCINQFDHARIPGTDSGNQIDVGRTFPCEQFGDGIDDATVVLPSSDSIRSTKSDDTVFSWRTSGSGSTLATSITSLLCKSTSKVWSGLSDVARSNKSAIMAQWRQRGLRPQPYEDSINLEAGAALPLQPLSGYGTYAACEKKSSSCSEGKESTSIHITFDFGCRSHTYDLEYAVFRQWKYVSLLVSAVQQDGVYCAMLWDESEGLQVMAGDWEARATPGWQVTIFCQDENVDPDDDNYSEGDDAKDEPCDVEKGYGEEWWFKRWKTRAEKKRDRQIKKQNPWMVGVVATTGIAIAFCIVSWFSFRECRMIAMD